MLDLEGLRARVESWGAWGPVAFVVMYAAGAVLLVPGTLFILTGGALFGPILGTIYNLSGAALGGTLAVLVSRYIVGESHMRWFGPRWVGGVEQAGRAGWRAVAFVRLIPAFPYNLVNYALGMTRIAAWDCLWATYVFYLPVTLVYTYMGYLGYQALFDSSGHPLVVLAMLVAMTLLVVVPTVLFRKRVRAMVSVDNQEQGEAEAVRVRRR